MKARTLLAALLTIFFLVAPAMGTPVPIVNYSFESYTTLNPSPWGSYSREITGWTFDGEGGYGVWDPTSASFSDGIPDGTYVGWLNGQGQGIAISQTLDWYVSANNTYTLLVDIGNRADNQDTVLFPNYSIDLLAGDSIIASSTFVEPAEGAFNTVQVVYTALDGDAFIGQALAVRIWSAGVQLNFDNVRLTNDAIEQIFDGPGEGENGAAPVPEPSTLVLLGLGILGVAGLTRRKMMK